MGVTYADKPWLSKYEAGVAKEITLPDQTVLDMLDASAKKHPEHTALFLKAKP
ncbi:MAG: hypothetical protein M5U34_41835 [Chloroflexi bacterium]|nr:hypothetical protein [Chloroflexota bacterium]